MKTIAVLVFAIALCFTSCTKSGTSAKIDSLQTTRHRFTINGQPVVIYAIPTGTIQIKHCHFTNCLSEDSSYPARLLRIFFSLQSHSELLPIFVYLIDHPGGRFLIDAGGDPTWDDDDSWRCDRKAKFASRILADVQVPAKEDLLSQLQSLGYKPNDINSVVVTHLHFDHTAALKSLNLPTYVGGSDLDSAEKIGAVTCKYLEGVKFRKVETLVSERPTMARKLGDTLFGPSLNLTDDGTLQVFPTPGHTPGSLSVELSTDQGQIWFVGDITFNDADILPTSEVAGMHFDIPQIRQIHEKMRILLNKERAIIVPSHDRLISKKLNAFLERP